MKNRFTLIAFPLALAWGTASASAQICQPNIRETTPAGQFVINAKQGTVLDKKTGLMWKRCLEGRSGPNCAEGAYAVFDWGSALAQAADSGHADYTDWRLPNVKELETLVEEKCRLPAINLTVFPDDAWVRVWSSTPYANDRHYAWRVGFKEGDTYYQSREEQLPVRLVRGALK